MISNEDMAIKEHAVEMVDNWTRYAGQIYSYVLRNEALFTEFKKTVAWQLIRSTAQGQETLHTVAKEATDNAGSNNHIR